MESSIFNPGNEEIEIPFTDLIFSEVITSEKNFIMIYKQGVLPIKYSSVDISCLFNNSYLSILLFGENYKVIVGIFSYLFSKVEINIVCLIDSNLILERITKSDDQTIFSEYIIEPHFIIKPVKIYPFIYGGFGDEILHEEFEDKIFFYHNVRLMININLGKLVYIASLLEGGYLYKFENGEMREISKIYYLGYPKDGIRKIYPFIEGEHFLINYSYLKDKIFYKFESGQELNIGKYLEYERHYDSDDNYIFENDVLSCVDDIFYYE